MKTVFKLSILCFVLLSSIAANAQTNYTATLGSGQEVNNMYGNICCFYKINVATDDAGNAYVLSSNSTDSSIWVTKYDNNGTLLYNIQAVSGFSPNNRYLGKKIRVYDRIYIVCRVFDPTWGESEAVFPLDKNTGAVDLNYTDFVPASGNTNCKLIDVYADGTTLWLIGQSVNGSGRTQVQVNRSDIATLSGNIFVYGNDAGTDYMLNTEATCFDFHNGALYLTGEAASSSGTNILIGKMDVWGIWSEYVYSNISYPIGGKGLRVAAEGNSVYVAGAMRAQVNKPVKTTVIKMDSSLTAPAWVTISAKSEWPQGLELSSSDVIYTVDYRLKVVGFSKTSGMQLFAKNDFSKNAQVYNQPISTALLNNDQLVFQASTGVVIGRGPNAVNTINKVLAKYSTSGMKVYQQMETLTSGSESAEALGIAYSSVSDYLVEVYRKNSSVYVQGRTSATALRPMAEQDETASQFSIYPNPSRSVVNITSPTTIDEIIITNATGQLVLREENINRQYSINLELPGIYFVKLISGNKVEMQRIIITK
jgi:hypothetical protein